MSKVRLLPRAGFATLFASAFAIQLSSDGSAWATASTEAAYAAQNGVWCEKKFTAQTARYVRLSIQATKLFPSNGLYYAQLAELEVHNPYFVGLSWRPPATTPSPAPPRATTSAGAPNPSPTTPRGPPLRNLTAHRRPQRRGLRKHLLWMQRTCRQGMFTSQCGRGMRGGGG